MNKRVVSVDFFRFLFMLQICLWHLGKCMGIMQHGYIAVEFFFILSGYLIYKSSVKKNAKGVFNYTWDKVKRFYPEVLLTTFPAWVVCWAVLDKSPWVLFNSIFFLQNTGIYGGGVNPALWYLSVLLLGGGLIYAILHNNKHLSVTVILPLLVLMVYTYIFKENEGSFELWGTRTCFYMPLWRGMAGMSLGCLVARLHEIKLSDSILKKRRILDCLCVMSLVGCFVVAFSDNTLDRYALFFYSIIVLSCFTEGTLVNKLFYSSAWNYLGELSFELLLVHMPIALFLMKADDKWGLSTTVMVFSYLVSIFVSAVLLRFIYNKLSSLFK